ncbi:unnamed protein product [Caenorhabditis auriculariae]|uniref:Cation-transporting ATPase n=1 Tax=Caenorhabditis auriculariae TaxID=2777116 RepID=A0A8S1GNC0_9PELO|nr:unnamed protein product [Caenorhabditis auriculariae]
MVTDNERIPLLTSSTADYESLEDIRRTMVSAKALNGNAIPKVDDELSVVSGDETIRLRSYRTTALRTVLFWTLSIITLGAYRLLAYWMKSVEVAVRFEKCSHTEATHIVIIDVHNENHIKAVTREEKKEGFLKPDKDGTLMKTDTISFFTYRKLRFIWYSDQSKWISPADLDSQALFSTFTKRVDDHNGLTDDTATQKRTVYGTNSLNIEAKPLVQLLFAEVLSPFYIFQLGSVILWFCDDYQFYASVIVIISLGSIFLALRDLRKQERKVIKMTKSSICVEVLRDGNVREVDASELVPGDIMLLAPHGTVMPCDALLLNGSAILNESMLTGESVPVTKVPLSGADDVGDNVRFNNEKHSRHLLYCGTQVLQARFYGNKPVRAVVVRTGFSTLKGQLVRSIMYPKPIDRKMMMDIVWFVIFLFGIAMCGFGYTVAIMIMRGKPFLKIFVRSLDIVTIVVPPALPAAMAVGVMRAQKRLKEKQIFCISPTTLNVCGKVNVVCFDKTGTLTEDGLDFQTMRAIIPAKDSKGLPKFTEEMEKLDPADFANQKADAKLITAAATCHSLTRIDGNLHGDPLDLILFNKSGWSIEEGSNSDSETEHFDMIQPTVLKPPNDGYQDRVGEYSIVRQFTFSSALQRMSVVVSNPSEDTAHDMTIYCKGSPEMILSLCDPQFVPEDYKNVVDHYSLRGYRLISVAYKKIDMNFAKAVKAPRNLMEFDLTLLGLIVMENRLKPVTLDVINELYTAKIRSVMVTGDNLLTAMSVARECGIIRPTKDAYLLQHDSTRHDALGRTVLTLTKSVSSDETIVDKTEEVRELDHKFDRFSSRYQLAVSGLTFAIVCKEYPDLVDQLVSVCDVFARMAPDQKSGLICALQKIDYTVAMCGDGANDCAALKAAHAGISLSDAEASIAAPFTSKVPDIRCVPKVIKEGRCALVTSFLSFRYMAAYSLNEFMSVMLLYYINANLTDFQFLYIDLILITVLALFLGNTGAAKRLALVPPASRLMSASSVTSILGQLFINGFAQVIAYLFIQNQSWFIPRDPEDSDIKTMQGTAIFLVSAFQYLTLVFTYSIGAPHRKIVFTNYPLCICWLVIAAFTFQLTMYPCSFEIKVMDEIYMPSVSFRYEIFGVAVASAVSAYLFELIVVQKLISAIERKMEERKVRHLEPTAPLFSRILVQNGANPQWLSSAIKREDMPDNFLKISMGLFDWISSAFEVTTFDIVVLLIAAVLFAVWYFKGSKPGPPPPPPPPPALKMTDMTLSELNEYDGVKKETILFALNGTIYDVTRGKSFYGPGGPYGALAGHDATRALATMSTDAVKNEWDDLSGLSPQEKETAEEWEQSFKFKYLAVGRLVRDDEEKLDYHGLTSSISGARTVAEIAAGGNPDKKND